MNMELSKDDQLALLIAQKVVLKLARDWQKNRCYWYSEIDIQAELRNRLQSAYSLVGLDMVHWESSEIGGSSSEEPKTARVQCEPQWSSRIPDVVVWGEKKEKDVPDDEWPALWACEIKYIKDTPENDVEKLKRYIEAEDALYGCSLSFQDGEEDFNQKPSEDEESNLHIIKVCAPRKNC